ncbi:MAG: Eco57I restriction-modification methylase domain-containing protein [Planctomycetaceae bacterium]|jgi:hypothetical protein|nr:Eco57I restriction-modification methylase domain-containing protein [Planctomycetaceae bacterium]
MSDIDLKKKIRQVITEFEGRDLTSVSLKLFETLEYNTTCRQPLVEKTSEHFINAYAKKSNFSKEKALTNKWKSIDLLFQLTSKEMSNKQSLFKAGRLDTQIIESYLFMAVDLLPKDESHNDYSRSEIADITREINKVFLMPALVIFRYEGKITIAIINRRVNKRDKEKDVMEKVTLIKDVSITNPHRAHIDILYDLSLPKIRQSEQQVSNFIELNNAWTKILDTKELHKRFYSELSNWYFWAIDKVTFPNDKINDNETCNAMNLIRLITRIIFVWFIKEKRLIPEKLFEQNKLGEIVKDFYKNDNSKNYYNAILQNLFFATLNQKMNARKFAEDGDFAHNRNEYGVKTLYRYADLFTISETDATKLFKEIPFLNGGLFDCLDKENDAGKVEYVDGFSRNTKKRAIIPDYLFFSDKKIVDLNSVYDTKGKKYEVRGLFNILRSYKFTVTENTPVEEEIALDPELLGKAFENLLACYNPETKISARKETGSFYTPREIVNYMVDESLIMYLKNYILSKQPEVKSIDSAQTNLVDNECKKEQLKSDPEQKLNHWANNEQELENKLRSLLSYETENPFDEKNTITIIKAIDDCNILDPACGSGAFPMGILHKIVLMLKKIDPNNKLWKEQQRERIIGQKIDELKNDKKLAAKLIDCEVREQAEKAVEKRLQELDEIFNSEYNFDDYSRKLFLIENCIYGVDIQTIAVQIAKLRFFISLVVDQKVNKEIPNCGIRSLPNLETKFVAADTLIGIERPNQQTFVQKAIEELEKQLKDVRHKYFIANTRNEKLKLQKEDKDIRKKIAEELIKLELKEQIANKIVDWDPYDQNANADWFDQNRMFGIKDGFDIVIGNPPYVQLQNNGGALAKLYEQCNFVTLVRKGDIYCLFYEQAYNLLKDGGSVCFITSNKWMRAGYGENTRKFFVENTNPEQLIDFAGVKVFESATVDVNILIFAKDKNKGKTKSCVIKNHGTEQLSVYIRQHAIAYSFSTSDNWVILSPIEQRIKAKIEAVGTPLKDWDIKINYGIKTGFNDAFIIDGKKKDELIAQDPKSAEIIRPILRGRDIKRYGYEFADLWLINTHNGVREKGIKPINISDYPAIKKHLDTFFPQLKKRADKGDTPYNLRNCAYLEDFYKQKIVYSEIVREPQFYLDKEGEYFPEATAFIMTGEHLEFLYSVLHTKAITYFFKTFYAGGGLGEDGYRYKKKFLELLPIPKPQKDFSSKNIDIYIYELYQLSKEEIEFIESL